MQALALLAILLAVMTLVFFGSILYGSTGFFVWGLGVVTLGAGMQLLLRHHGVSCGTNPRRRETAIEVLKSGSFLRVYPPLPTAVALVAMAIFMEEVPGLVLAPLMIVMAGTSFWQARSRR